MATKEELKKDLLKIAETFSKKFNKPACEITRDYYRNSSKISRDFEVLYGSFKQFKEDCFSKEDLEKGQEFELEKKMIVLKDENKKLKKEKDEILRNSIDEEKILETLSNKKIEINLPKKLSIGKIKKGNHQEAILLLSDFHCGQVVYKEEVNGVNEYNIEIMKKRLDRIFYYFIYFCKQFDVHIANLFFLGDLWQGSLRREADRNNEKNEVEILFILSEYIVEKILQIEPFFDKITCEFLAGNHSRILEGKPYYEEAAEMNWENILAKHLQKMFDLIQVKNNKKIIINSNDSVFKIVNVTGRKFLLTHGEMLTKGSNSFLGISYYGIAASASKIFGAFYKMDDKEQEFSDILMGHLHTAFRMRIPTGNVYGNGSVVGTDPFALYRMKSISEPEQTMLICDNGIVTNEIILKCDEIVKK